MVKWLGIILIFAACCYFGEISCKNLFRRRNFLGDATVFIGTLKSKIRFTGEEIYSAVRESASQPLVKKYFGGFNVVSGEDKPLVPKLPDFVAPSENPAGVFSVDLRRFCNMGLADDASGNGKGEPEVAAEIAKIPDPALIVIDYEANTPSAPALKKTLAPFIAILREKHPVVPILVLTKIRYAEEGRDRKRGDDLPRLPYAQMARQAQFETVEELKKTDPNLYFLGGDDLLGEDFDECCVDGVHPTDLGFYRMTENLEPVIREILSR